MATVTAGEGPGLDEDREGIPRDRLAMIVAILVLVGVGGLAARTLLTKEDPPPPDPEAAAVAWAEAWIDNDLDRMEELLVEPEGPRLREAHASLEALDPKNVAIDLLAIDHGDDQNRAGALMAVTYELEHGDMAWRAVIPMERSRATWRIRWSPRVTHPILDDGITFELREVVAPRAPLLAFDGTPLSQTEDVLTIGIEPRRIADEDRTMRTLRSLLPEAVDRLERTLRRDDLIDTWFYPLVTVPVSRLDMIRPQVEAIAGIIIREGAGRVSTTGGFASHLLGDVRELTAEQADERGLPEGTLGGVGGLEEAFDDELRAGTVFEVVALESDGDVRAVVATISDDPGEAVLTTIDARVQQAAENALVGRSDNIAIVAISPETGGLLASASRPLTGYNRAFLGRYPPGAAALPVFLTAAVPVGATSQLLAPCPEETFVGGVRITNLDGFAQDEVTLPEAMAYGCRTAIATLSEPMIEGSLAAVADRFGYSIAPELVLETRTGDWPQARDTAERATSAIGQARTLSTPVHLASTAAALVSSTWRIPHVIPTDAQPDRDVTINEAVTERIATILLEAGAHMGLPEGTGGGAGTGSSSEGELGWAFGTREDIAVVILIEESDRGEAVDLLVRFLAELDALG